MNEIIKEDIENITAVDLSWDKLKGCSVLITGATGYLAHYMVLTMLMRNDLYDEQIIVIALCRNKAKAKALYKENYERDDLVFLFQDVTEDIQYHGKIDYIIHAASPANSYVIMDNPWGVVSANINGFEKVFQISKYSKLKRIMLFSSYTIYGSWSLEHPPKETDSCVANLENGRSIYAISKLLCEAMAQEVKAQAETVIVRPSVIYGPGAVASQKKHFTDFILNCVKNEPIKVMSSGNVVRNFLYITDAVIGFFQVLLEGEAEPYNVASDSTLSVLQLAQIIAKQKNLDVVFDLANQEDYHKKADNVVNADNSKLKQLGWKQQVTIEEGIRRTIKWAESDDYFVNW